MQGLMTGRGGFQSPKPSLKEGEVGLVPVLKQGDAGLVPALRQGDAGRVSASITGYND